MIVLYYSSLAGPFDVLLGKRAASDTDYLLHHRFYYDLPEFQTVLISEFYSTLGVATVVADVFIHPQLCHTRMVTTEVVVG